jgi:hypothetical protein
MHPDGRRPVLWAAHVAILRDLGNDRREPDPAISVGRLWPAAIA